MSITLTSLVPFGFLLVAVIDDLCFKKFHNWMFITLTVLASGYVFWMTVPTPFQALGGFVVGGALMMPLVLMGAIGAGDMKFMMCFGILMGTIKTFEIFVYALFWGALIGVLQSLLAGKIIQLFNNLTVFWYRLKPTETQKIPYTVAILFGWMTHLQFGGLL